MKMILPWLKFFIAIIGLYFALHVSSLVVNNYILKDQMIAVAKIGNELSNEAKEVLKKESLKEAYFHLTIIFLGVLASGLWLAAPFTKAHNKAPHPTPKSGAAGL